MNRIAFIVAIAGCFSSLSLARSAEPAAAATVDIYLAESGPVAGLKQVEVADRKDDVISLHKDPVLTRAGIAAARVVTDTNDQPAIEIVFTEPAQKELAKVTSENIGKRLAIVVGGKVISAPRIASQIAERATINGAFSKADAEKLAQAIQPGNP